MGFKFHLHMIYQIFPVYKYNLAQHSLWYTCIYISDIEFHESHISAKCTSIILSCACTDPSHLQSSPIYFQRGHTILRLLKFIIMMTPHPHVSTVIFITSCCAIFPGTPSQTTTNWCWTSPRTAWQMLQQRCAMWISSAGTSAQLVCKQEKCSLYEQWMSHVTNRYKEDPDSPQNL